MKKLLSVILTICLVIAVVPMGAFSITANAETATSGITGDCTWTLDGTVLTISGNGDMGSYGYMSWGKDITKVIIEDGVTSIGEKAFAYCSFESVIIPKSVNYIGVLAFCCCYNLTNITIPNSVVHIGYRAFADCSSLENINVEANNLYYASVGGVLFDKNLKTIIRYPQGKTNTSYSIPNNITSIGGSAFYNCIGLTSITIPNSVTSIGDLAFDNCTGLTSITIPNSVTSISAAFRGCTSLTGITIPNSVTSIGGSAFDGCTNLENIDVYVDNLNYASIDGALFDKNLKTIIRYPEGKTNTSYSIPKGVINIDESAFYGCSNLTGITLPNTVTRIAGSAFNDCSSLTNITIPSSVTSISHYLFEGCTSLENINVEANNLYYASVGGVLFDKNLKTIIRYPQGKTSSLYSILDSVTSIGDYAFSGCSSLTDIIIPNGLKSIEWYAFYDCSELKDVWYTGSKAEKIEILIKDNNGNLTSATWHYNTCSDEHTYSGACDKTCNACGYVRTVGAHNYETKCNNEQHYEKCSECGDEINFANHDYDNDCDTTCNICGYKRTVTHNTEGAEWVITATSHRKVCTVCGEKVEESNHTYDDANDAFCNICGHIRALKEFPDVPVGAWFNEPVNYVVGKGIMKGYGGTDLFGAANNLQREEFILMLARYAGVNLDTYEAQESKFSDVPEGAWFEGAINWGAENGIITGYGNTGVFGVGDTITREQLVLMLYRYAKSIGKDVTVGADAATNAANRFVDFGSVSDWATDAVLWAVENGVITGAGAQKNLVNPQGNAQRCEIAQIMYNIYKNAVL